MNPLNDKPIEAQDQSRGEPMDLLSDEPIERPEKDKFDFKRFAQSIARSIIKNNNPEGIVIAINGPWGSGKSSVINLVKHYLEEKVKSNQSPDSFEFPRRALNWLKSLAPKMCSRQIDGDTINASNVSLEILEFKCWWWFRGEEALMIEFFHQLYRALDKSGLEVAKKAVSRLGSIMLRNLAPLAGATTNHFAPGTGEMASTGMNLLSKIIQEEETVEMLYYEISQALSKSKKRYMIIIDDIDRLSPDEALLIFRLVKSVGQLPRITYLLAYDRDLAEKIVSKRYPSEEPHYLEKIVQASFDIPYPRYWDLRNFFLKSLRKLLEEIEELYDQQQLENLFNAVLASEIQSPRDSIRIMNVLSVTWPAVAGEVYPADFLALETLRVKQPHLHAILKANKQKLTGTDVDIYNASSPNENRNMRESHYEEIFLGGLLNQKREEMKQVLSLLFPPLDSVWERSSTSSSDRDNWKRQRRACSPEHFDTYFRFSLSPETISIEKVNEVIRNSNNVNYIKTEFLEASKIEKDNGNGTNVSIFLDELEIHAKNIPIENAKNFLSALFTIHDKIDTELDESSSPIWTDNSNRMYYLLRNFLLDRTKLVQRSKIIYPILRNGDLGLIVSLIHREYHNHGLLQNQSPIPEHECLMTKPDLENLRPVVLGKIQASAEDGSLLRNRKLLYALDLWRLLDNSEEEEKEVKFWCMKQLNEDTAVEIFAKIFIQEGTSVSLIDGNSVPTRSYSVQINVLERFFDTEKLIQRVEELLAVSNPDSERYTILNRFRDAFRNNSVYIGE